MGSIRLFRDEAPQATLRSSHNHRPEALIINVGASPVRITRTGPMTAKRHEYRRRASAGCRSITRVHRTYQDAPNNASAPTAPHIPRRWETSPEMRAASRAETSSSARRPGAKGVDKVRERKRDPALVPWPNGVAQLGTANRAWSCRHSRESGDSRITVAFAQRRRHWDGGTR